MALGQIPDPRTGERMLDLNLAKETIDLLGVLESKTVGNRSDEEESMIEKAIMKKWNKLGHLIFWHKKVKKTQKFR